MTTDNRLLCEGERVPEKDVENPGERNNQKNRKEIVLHTCRRKTP